MKSDTYKELKGIEVGQTLYECQSGINIKFAVSEAPNETFSDDLNSNQLSWKGVDVDGEEINFMMTETSTHYGPRIYDYKAYTDCTIAAGE